MARLDRRAINRIILSDTYPTATDEQLDRGAEFQTTAPFGPKAAEYDLDPDQFRRDLETEMFGSPKPSHQHVVNEHSQLKFNGGHPVWLCGHDSGRCRIIVCYAEWDHASASWVEGERW